MRRMISLLGIIAILGLTGCAHQIQLNPDLSSLPTATQMSDKSVAYVMTDAQRSLSVTTPGGGGDKVTYQPYRDTETALYTVLSRQFARVFVLASVDDQETIEKNDIAYIFTPTIKTTSSSDSLFTWPPTRFSYELSCLAVNDQGNTVWQNTVTGEGEAEFEEFTADFSLAARRATQKAFEKLAIELNDSAELK